MKRRIILGLTGSVASILYLKLVEALQRDFIVDVILTEKSNHFIDIVELIRFVKMKGGQVYTDASEWTWIHGPKGHPESYVAEFSNKWERNDPVLHINLRDNASALVIAPCSANTLAKIANGMSDNLLTSVARAWDVNRLMVIAPAMNTHMWTHRVTAKHLQNYRLFSENNWIINPQEKMLACNTFGMGAMADVDTISSYVKNLLRWAFPIQCPAAEQMGIPIEGHPGAFKAQRKNSTHTGIDIYVDAGEKVVPVEDGKVVAVEPFTGPKDNSPWWLDTDCVLVEGASGVICYGEIKPIVKVGQSVKRAYTVIGTVLRVIPPDRPQHPELQGWKPSMLHMEWYPHGYYKPSDGYGNSFTYLQDPTQLLIDSTGAPDKTFTI